MQYDIAVQTIIGLDDRYSPFAIYADKGAGEYQLELLRKALGDKVKGVFYGSSTEVRDPVTRQIEKKSLKPFLVNQTVLLLERGQLRLPNKEISEIIHRQMTNFQVVRVSERTQEPSYTSEDEHGLDAMIFGLYAFLEKYPDLMDTVVQTKYESAVTTIKTGHKNIMDAINKQTETTFSKKSSIDNDEPTPRYRKVPLGFSKRKTGGMGPSSLGWGSNYNKNAQNIWKRPF